MESELQNKFEEVLLSLITQAEDAAVFIKGEIPEVLEQLLMWEFAHSLAMFIIGVLIPVAVFIGSRFWWSKIKDKDAGSSNEFMGIDHNYSFPWFFLSVIASVIALAAFNRLINLTWLQIWLAPKVYLIEYSSELVK